MATKTFHLPVRPYSPVAALNRKAAALGSPGYAQAAGNADYNGHRVTLSWHSYRGSYSAEYVWAGRIVLARGSFDTCLAAVLAEYNRGALGASAVVTPREGDDKALKLCTSTAGLLPGTETHQPWRTWQHECAVLAARDSAYPQMPVMMFDWTLMQASENRAAYEAALKSKYGRVYA